MRDVSDSDQGDDCPGHASPEDRPCHYDPSDYADPKPEAGRECSARRAPSCKPPGRHDPELYDLRDEMVRSAHAQIDGGNLSPAAAYWAARLARIIGTGVAPKQAVHCCVPMPSLRDTTPSPMHLSHFRPAQVAAASPEHWEIRNERGQHVNPDATLRDLGLTDASRLFLCLGLGWGGADETHPKPDTATDVDAFEEAWAEKERQGYQYGSDALEQVRFGWDIAQKKLRSERDRLRADLNAALERVDVLNGISLASGDNLHAARRERDAAREQHEITKLSLAQMDRLNEELRTENEFLRGNIDVGLKERDAARAEAERLRETLRAECSAGATHFARAEKAEAEAKRLREENEINRSGCVRLCELLAPRTEDRLPGETWVDAAERNARGESATERTLLSTPRSQTGT